MIMRRCSQGHRVRVHRNTTPGVTRIKTYPDSSQETLVYPSSYTYFVDVDGEVAKKSNSLKTVEEFYVDECAKKHGEGHGRLIVGKHQIINGVATSQSDYPSSSNTKSEIQDFYDKRGISYNDSDTKEQLLSKIYTDTSGVKHMVK